MSKDVAVHVTAHVTIHVTVHHFARAKKRYEYALDSMQ